jgi:hypothetical protein
MIQYAIYTSYGGALIGDYSHKASGVAFATNERGFAECTAFLSLSMQESFDLFDIAGTPYVQCFAGGVLFGGRLEDRDLTDGGVTITALGYSRALSDAPYTALWSATQVSAWYAATDRELTNAGPSRFQIDTNNRLFIAPQLNATYANAGANFMIGGLVFDLPSGASRNANAGGIQFSYDTNTPLNWVTRLQTANAAGTLIGTEWTLNSTGAQATGAIFLHALGGNPTRFIFQLFYNAAAAAYAGETGAAYLKITNLRITTGRAHEVNTGWSLPAGPVTGVQTVTPTSMAGIYLGQQLVCRQGTVNGEIVTVTAITSTTFTATFTKTMQAGVTIQACQVYADDIADDLLSVTDTLNSTQISSDTALIASPGLDLLNEVYEDQLPSDILDYLAGIGDTSGNQWEWGVGDNQRLYFRRQGSAARTWYIDVSAIDVQRLLDALSNSVYAVYQDTANRTLRAAATSDAASVARYGVTRRQALSVSSTSTVQAAAQQAAALADGKDPKPRSGVVIDKVFDANGARWPLWSVAAGDTVIIRNLAPTLSTSIDRIRVFRLSRASYDVDSDTLTIEPETPRPSLEALLAQLAAGVQRQVRKKR